jgi:hypothetical protein
MFALGGGNAFGTKSLDGECHGFTVFGKAVFFERVIAP